MRPVLLMAVGAALLSVAAPVLAASSAATPDTTTSTRPLPAGASALPALFKQLDANGDGLLSEAEASAVPSIAGAYDSFDTTATIQQPQQNASASGITLEQFEAGMQAAGQGGAFGPAVSGGNHYLQYPDGSREELNTSKAPTS